MEKQTMTFTLIVDAAKRFLMCLAVGFALSCVLSPAQAAPSAFGINLPWNNFGGDFGASPRYPGYGPTYNGAQMQVYLDDIRSKHMNIVRIWLFEDECGLTFTGNRCNGVSQVALNNITDFVNRANADHLTVYCTLFDFRMPPGYITSDGGVSLVRTVVKPLARALKGKQVMYDIMNECDYEIPAIGWPTMRGFLKNSATAIHSISSSTWVTASNDHSDDFNYSFSITMGGLGFNFYDYHQYSNVNTPLRVLPSAVGGAPLYLGEFGPSGQGWGQQSDADNSSLIDYFAAEVNSKGYAGMLAWSYNDDGTNYSLKNLNAIYTLDYYGNLWGINR